MNIAKGFFSIPSPQGDRVRSRVELATLLEGILDLSNFEYKTGKFGEGLIPSTRVRNRTKVLASFYHHIKCQMF